MHWLKKKHHPTVNAGRDREMGGEITQPATNGVSQGPSGNSKNAIDGTNHLMASPANDNLNSENEVASNSDGLPISQKSSDLLSKHFQIKRWDACACWSWDVMHDTCVICRNVLMSLCIHCQAKVGSSPMNESCLVAWGACNLVRDAFQRVLGISPIHLFWAIFDALSPWK
ncbi:unnamed protein product [Heterobilharzia americana]|nr:unnamed protein product [Heterobilharzia americana]